jgi:hypothetical protein
LDFVFSTAESWFRYHVRTTLHPMYGESRAVNGQISFEPAAFEAAASAPTPVAVTGRATIPLTSFRAQESGADKPVLEWTEASRFPNIVIEPKSARPNPSVRGGWLVTTAVSFHGQSRSFEVPVWASLAGGRLTLRGEFEFTMTEFGIKPPTVMLVLKSKDYLKAEFEIVAVAP